MKFFSLKLPRLQLFEFCDLPYLPKQIRSIFYEVLVFSGKIGKSNFNMDKVIQNFVERSKCTRLAELASGNGRNSVPAIMSLPREIRPHLILTDFLPQIDEYSKLQVEKGKENLSFIADPISFTD